MNRALLVFVVAVLAGCASKERLPSPQPPTPMAVPMPTQLPPPRPQTPVTASAPQTVPNVQGKVQGDVWSGPEIFFDTQSAALKPAEALKLKKLAEQFNNTGTLHIKAYTDSGKNSVFNNNLSIKRIDAVTAYLQSVGVERLKIAANDQKSPPPAANHKTTDGRALNNRVEIEIYSLGKTLAWKPENQIPVLFATNRQRTGKDNPLDFYDDNVTKKTDIQRGLAIIKVPPKHVRGKVERPSWVMSKLELFTKTELARNLNIKERTAENLITDFSYVDKIQELDKPVFDAELAKAVNKSKSKTAVLYIHGYANSFKDATFRTAQIAYDLATPEYDVVPLMFSWPSDPGMMNLNYIKARDEERLTASSQALANFLREIKNNTKIGTVHIIAHSMGAEVLGQAMIELKDEMGDFEAGKPTLIKPVFRQIIFAAPDVSVKTFNNVIAPAIKSHHTITTYGTGGDIALLFSSIINGEKRQGRLLQKGAKECVDTVDVTAVAKEGDFLKHSTWSESTRVLDDLRAVLRDGLNPLSRGLTPGSKDKGNWLLPEIDSWKNIKTLSQPTPTNPAAWGCSQ